MAAALRPTRSLVTGLTVLLISMMVLGTLGAVLGLVQGLFFPELAVEDEPEELGASLMLVAVGCQALVYLAVMIPCAVLFCVFLYRANQNARTLGSEGMEYTPGWTVGWFFIPIANLFKPYRAVQEVYLASDPDAGPRDWYRRASPGLLAWWWGLWIASNAFGMVAFRAALSSDVGVRAITPWFDVVDGLLEIPLALLALAVVKAIHRRQTEKAARALG